jgi:hypothetical protein
MPRTVSSPARLRIACVAACLITAAVGGTAIHLAGNGNLGILGVPSAAKPVAAVGLNPPADSARSHVLPQRPAGVTSGVTGLRD